MITRIGACGNGSLYTTSEQRLILAARSCAACKLPDRELVTQECHAVGQVVREDSIFELLIVAHWHIPHVVSTRAEERMRTALSI